VVQMTIRWREHVAEEVPVQDGDGESVREREATPGRGALRPPVGDAPRIDGIPPAVSDARWHRVGLQRSVAGRGCVRRGAVRRCRTAAASGWRGSR
jgi:hypothetical protein